MRGGAWNGREGIGNGTDLRESLVGRQLFLFGVVDDVVTRAKRGQEPPVISLELRPLQQVAHPHPNALRFGRVSRADAATSGANSVYKRPQTQKAKETKKERKKGEWRKEREEKRKEEWRKEVKEEVARPPARSARAGAKTPRPVKLRQGQAISNFRLKRMAAGHCLRGSALTFPHGTATQQTSSS
eukprot:GHVT01034353.1.p2 GENE.GHVT01034353.1~~GHVT01034353.1.p2  ORF type:complete len:186 (-),score=35.95 GHVT01034353.1:1479-2036(-)